MKKTLSLRGALSDTIATSELLNSRSTKQISSPLELCMSSRVISTEPNENRLKPDFEPTANDL